MAGVYIHIPFCKQLCTYCDFYFSVSLQRKNDILTALLREMDLRENEAQYITQANKQNGNIPTLYFGGGTPTVYSANELKQLADKALLLFLPNGVTEFTVESNPDDLTAEYLHSLKNIGVNRLSIGIQSFIDKHLQWMHRRHNAQQAIDSVKLAQQAGFNNITIDLIYGIPDMSMDEWAHNIQQAIALNVPHISAYHLTIEPKTILGRQHQRGLLKPIDDEISAQQYAMLEEALNAAGYIHYEISNFAKPGYFSAHNSSYWRQQPYIGIGPSAHSYNGSNLRKWNVANNKQYIEAIQLGENYYEDETLSVYDRYNEYILTSLRTLWGAELEVIKSLFGNSLYHFFLKQATPLIKSERLFCNNGIVCIPTEYFLISDSIINQLFWV